MFIPPCDLLFCTVNQLESMEDEDIGSGGIKKKRMRWEKGELEKEKVTGVS